MSKFGSAFAAARKAGKKVFSFGGKSYNTKVAADTPQKGPIPSAKPTTKVRSPGPKAPDKTGSGRPGVVAPNKSNKKKAGGALPVGGKTVGTGGGGLSGKPVVGTGGSGTSGDSPLKSKKKKTVTNQRAKVLATQKKKK